MRLSTNILSYLKNLFYTKEEVDSELSSKSDTTHTHTVDSSLSDSSTNPVQNKVINDALAGKASTSTATSSSNGLMSSSDKSKLDGVAANANNYSLPTASSSTLGGVKVGTNLSISNGILSATNTTYGTASSSSNGLMSSSDKSKLDGIASNANNYSLPTASSSTLGGIKVGSNLSISNGILSATNTTYGVATTSANGLMSSSDKSKLNGIASGATANTIDSSLSSTSTNAVQNKVINSALAGKAASSHTHDPSVTYNIKNDSEGKMILYQIGRLIIIDYNFTKVIASSGWTNIGYFSNVYLPNSVTYKDFVIIGHNGQIALLSFKSTGAVDCAYGPGWSQMYSGTVFWFK